MDEETVDTIKRLIQQYRQHEYIVALAEDGPLSVEHINGGHLNHVGRVVSADGCKSCIVKVYMNYVKFLGPGMPIETERCQRENMASHYFRSLVEDCCPLPYFFDEVHHIGFLEDFPEHQEWGQVLRSHSELKTGARIADILVSLHSSTYRGSLSPDDFHGLCCKFRALPKQVNFLCQAQFVKPFQDNHRDYKPDCHPDVRRRVDQLIGDNLVVSAAKCVRELMAVESGNCLIHGDLHLENILYNHADDNVMLIDTDCVRVGPEAYDVGLLVCNYILLYHYHQELRHTEVGPGLPDHCQLMIDMLHIINITMSRYMDGMSRALQDKFDRQTIWRQALLFVAVEVIGWISGPASFDYIDANPKIMLQCLDTAYKILQRMPPDSAQLCHLILPERKL